MYTKRAHFLPRSPEIWICGWGKMEKKCMKRQGNNVGSCPFLPMKHQNTDLGMGKCEKHLKSAKSKYSF